jgi:AcrR family transcriptional regulator
MDLKTFHNPKIGITKGTFYIHFKSKDQVNVEHYKNDEVIPFISKVGFPILVTLYLLYRIEANLDVVVTSI